MYMPNLAPRDDAHRLWLDGNDENELNPHIQPLSSYSPAYPGSLNRVKIDQTRRSEFFKLIKNNDKIDPTLNVNNLISSEYLQGFEKLGYDYLKPIGLNKTMRQLDEERHEMEELQRNNNNGDFYGNEEEEEEEVDNAAVAISGTGIVMGAQLDSATAHDEESFDALLAENTRSMNNSATSGIVHDQFQFENNQDFMAEDEEYQDDHSISMDSDTNTSRRIVRSIPIYMGANTLTAPQPAQGYETRSYYRHVSNGSVSGMSSLRNEVRISSVNSDYDI